MRLRDDFSRHEVVRPGEEAWRPSPTPGVERIMLDRIGEEVARATSIVRYAPNATFPRHVHGGGEEILVLEGLFTDESGQYPAGSYVRNPIGSAHAPAAGPQGATLFVKLHQFEPGDTRQLAIDTTGADWSPGPAPGMSILPLHEFAQKRVALQRWAPDTRFEPHRHPGGEEILVLEGTFHDEHGTYPCGTWLRSPPFSEHAPFTGSEGALIYLKLGHLPG